MYDSLKYASLVRYTYIIGLAGLYRVKSMYYKPSFPFGTVKGKVLLNVHCVLSSVPCYYRTCYPLVLLYKMLVPVLSGNLFVRYCVHSTQV